MKSVLYVRVPGFASAMLVAIIVSLVTYKKNPVIDEEFESELLLRPKMNHKDGTRSHADIHF